MSGERLSATTSPTSRWRQNVNWWLRRFLSLRWQFALVFIALLILFLLVFSSMVYSVVTAQLSTYRFAGTTLNSLWMAIVIALVAMIVVGSMASFLLVHIMLGPLRRMRDAAQAIAFGDLKQRVRLPHSDDEVGDLAVYLNQIVGQVERAHEVQLAAEERVRRFISDVSHELRTPLTSLRGFTDVLLRGAKDDPETLQHSLRLMKQETERMSRLINELLVLARLDEGQTQKFERVDVLELARETLEQAQQQVVDGRTLTLDVETQEQPLEVLAEEDNLKQVLQILFDNAIKYGCPGEDGKIVLAIDKRDGKILLQVSDNGRGIPAEDIPRVFERFYRGQRLPVFTADGAPVVGAGLGLSIAQAIVKASRGDISVESEAGKGTTVTVKLPHA